MPVYNAEYYISDAINSVLNQSYPDWELIIIDDGSNDSSCKIMSGFEDSRIRLFKQENSGVSAARNLGLSNMKGDYFCFLDADDLLTKTSLEARFKIFERDKNIEFVDGAVIRKNVSLSTIEGSWMPQIQGLVFNDLISLTGKSFCGISWMFKRIPDRQYNFREDMSYSEDLQFYLDQSKYNGQYSFTDDVIYVIRNTQNSAMSNLGGLEDGYKKLFYNLSDFGLSDLELKKFERKARSIVHRSYLGNGFISKSLRNIFFDWHTGRFSPLI